MCETNTHTHTHTVRISINVLAQVLTCTLIRDTEERAGWWLCRERENRRTYRAVVDVKRKGLDIATVRRVMTGEGRVREGASGGH